MLCIYKRGLGQLDGQTLRYLELSHTAALWFHIKQYYMCTAPCFVLVLRWSQLQSAAVSELSRQAAADISAGAVQVASYYWQEARRILRFVLCAVGVSISISLSLFLATFFFLLYHLLPKLAAINLSCTLAGGLSVELSLSRLARLTLSNPAGSFS